MPFDKERQIQAIRIFLTVFYGFLLPDPYLIRAIFYTIQRSEPFYIVWLMIDSAVRLIWVILVIYATWFEKNAALYVSGVVLSVIFLLKSFFGLFGNRRFPTRNPFVNYLFVRGTDPIGHIQVSIELLVILLAIVATFRFSRYIKAKYAPVSTQSA